LALQAVTELIAVKLSIVATYQRTVTLPAAEQATFLPSVLLEKDQTCYQLFASIHCIERHARY
jgi:hypothetical protein